MKKLSLLACAILLLQTDAAQSAIFGSATQIGGVGGSMPSFGSPDAGLNGTTYVSYVLSVAGNSGETITALDVKLCGCFHQRWADADEDGVFEPSPRGNAAAPTRGDSFLIIPPGAAVAEAATEDNSFSGSPLRSTATRQYGIGTTMSFAAGFDPPLSVQFAYIVMARGTERSLFFDVKVATRDASGNPGPTIELNNSSWGLPTVGASCIPEPSSAALVLFASLALVNRQGRRADLLVLG